MYDFSLFPSEDLIQSCKMNPKQFCPHRGQCYDPARKGVLIRVARWHIFKAKIPILVIFEGSCNGRCWYIILPVGLFYGYLAYFVSVWCILRLSGISFPRFGMLFQGKSGNPGPDQKNVLRGPKVSAVQFLHWVRRLCIRRLASNCDIFWTKKKKFLSIRHRFFSVFFAATYSGMGEKRLSIKNLFFKKLRQSL
jgi:hypothetical protein